MAYKAPRPSSRKPRGNAWDIPRAYGADEAHWTSLEDNDYGVPIRLGEGTWPTIHVGGDFSGAKVALQGSHGDHIVGGEMRWVMLSPPPLTAPGVFRPLKTDEHYQFGRPVVMGGDFNTRIDVRCSRP
jgi:hypothetical protein